MKSIPLIHTSWLKPFADYFEEPQIKLGKYYRAAQIEANQVTSGDGWITKHQLYLFLNALAEGEKMPEIGFLVGETITPEKLGAIGSAMSESSTLGGVIRTFCQLVNRHAEENRCWLEEGNTGEVWLFDQKLASFEADRAIADHAGLTSMVNLARLIGGNDWYPEKMNFQTQPTTAYRKIPGLKNTEIKFEQSASGFAFPTQWLLQPIRIATRRSPAETVSGGLLDKDESIVKKLQRLLYEIVGIGGIAPTFVLMAELCGKSPRSLQRYLKEENVTYRKLMDRVRLDLAKSRLHDSDVSVKELAFELGYSGANNFIRAFSRLTGKSPGQFRVEYLARSPANQQQQQQ